MQLADVIGRLPEFACHTYARSHGEYAGDLVVEPLLVHDYLKIFEAGAVVDLDKSHRFGVARRAHPTAHRYFFAEVACIIGENLSYINVFHKRLPLLRRSVRRRNVLRNGKYSVASVDTIISTLGKKSNICNGQFEKIRFQDK